MLSLESAFIDWRGNVNISVTSLILSTPESEMAESTLRTRSDSTGCAVCIFNALWMLQAGRGNAENLVPLQSLGCFDESADYQALKYLLHLVLRHVRREPYLCGIRYILSRDRRQHTFLVARQKSSFVTRTHHDPKGVA
jgi:hypothetical protein